MNAIVEQFLATLVCAMQANRILEIGTGSGSATIAMALAQPPAGRIWTFDPDIARTEAAQRSFEKAGVADRIEMINQPAIEVLHVFPQRNMDIVFVDAPRSEYEQYLETCLHLLKLSGLIVFNNVRTEPADERFAQSFLKNARLQSVILPLGGGLAIGARKQ